MTDLAAPAPTGWSLLRASLAPVVDMVAVSLLVVLGWRVMFGGSYPFETWAWWVGSIGTLACWLQAGASRSVPVPLLLYCGAVLVSAAVNRWVLDVGVPGRDWFGLLTPASGLCSWALLVYGAAHLLRTPWRIAVLVLGLVTSASLLGVQILFDRAATGFFYERVGSSSIPSVFQWGSLHQTGLVLLIALPFPLAVLLLGQSRSQRLSGLVVAAGLLGMGYVNGSRTGVLVMAVSVAAMGLALLWHRGAGSTARRAVQAVVLIGSAVGLAYVIFSSSGSMPRVTSLTGDRAPIWTAATMMTIDHPWFGVGPGNFATSMQVDEYALKYLPWYPYNKGGIQNAHNMVLHASAEVGIAGALALVLLWWSMFMSCVRAWAGDRVPLLAVGLGGAIAAYFSRSMADSFMDNLVTSDRTRIVVALMLGAAWALNRLTASHSSRANE